jgi:UDPglucose 6-dehydrogenase
MVTSLGAFFKQGASMNINIIGNGVVGNTLVEWVTKYNQKIKCNIYDPAQNIMNDMSYAGVSFIAVPVPLKSFKQDLSIIEESIERTNEESLIFMRSTVLPHTCDMLSEKYNRTICSMPEFLTERRAYRDFEKTNKLIIGLPEKAIHTVIDIDHVLNNIFKGKKDIEYLQAKETEMTKYIHNCFGAVKVTYFNAIHHLCKIHGINFDNAMKNIFETGFINREHTMVPHGDGFGYAGTCFPNNIDSIIGFCDKDMTGKFFQDIHCLNRFIRKTYN